MSAGPGCPEGQMTVWTKSPCNNYKMWYSQFPGHHDYRLDPNPSKPTWGPQTNTIENNPYAGKPGQAHWANEYRNPNNQLPVVSVGYSAGADSAVLYAELRQKKNLPIKAVVLIDPAFDSYDLNGNKIGLTEYQEKIQNLTDANIPVLIIDTTGQFKNQFPSAHYAQPIEWDHGTVDDSPELMNAIWQFLFPWEI